jgi:hypothetical protein
MTHDVNKCKMVRIQEQAHLLPLDPESGVEAGVQIRKKLSEWVYRFGAIRSDPAVHEMPFGVVGYAVVAIL